MALRFLRYDGDPVLKKKSKPIPAITEKVKNLGEDLVDTLQKEGGVGLAAPQVGILKRIIVVDFSDDEDFKDQFADGPIIAVNPEILSTEGEITGTEACLSFPSIWCYVSRPEKVTVKYQNLNGEEITAEFTDMPARCFCHEIDHLDGVVLLDRAIEGSINQIYEQDIHEEGSDGEED